LTGGFTSQTVFPATEERLHETDVQLALDKVMKRKHADRYHSLMDFVFNELFPDPWRWRCFRYYNDQGPKILDDPLMTDELLKAYDLIMSKVFIPICLEALKEARWVSWSKARGDMFKFFEAA